MNINVLPSRTTHIYLYGIQSTHYFIISLLWIKMCQKCAKISRRIRRTRLGIALLIYPRVPYGTFWQLCHQGPISTSFFRVPYGSFCCQCHLCYQGPISITFARVPYGCESSEIPFENFISNFSPIINSLGLIDQYIIYK